MCCLLGGQFYLIGFEVDPDPDRIRVPLDQSIRIQDEKMKSQKRKVSCLKNCMSFFNCKVLVITNQNLDLNPDSQKSLGMEYGCGTRMSRCHPLYKSITSMLGINQGTRETHLSACQTSFRASCLLTRLPVSLPGYLSACPATC